MPRPNRPRAVTHETVLARRLQHEREKRHMSYESLAQRMTQAGCSMQGSAIYKIEKGDPPRRITVNELVEFARIFGLDVPNLLLPPGLAARQEVRELVAELRSVMATRLRVFETAEQRQDEIMARLKELLDAGDNTASAIRAELNLWLGAQEGGWGQRMLDMVRDADGER